MIDGSLTPMIDLRSLTKVYQTPVGPFPALARHRPSSRAG